jgi:hypothetical protein
MKPVLTMAAIAATIFAALPAHAGSQPVTEKTTGWDIIAFELKSWGRPLHSWMIMSAGSGSLTEATSKPGGNYSEYSLTVREVEAAETGYAELQEILFTLPQPAPDSNNCASFMTDMPYGTIRMTRGATTTEIAFNSGCQDGRYRAFMDILKAADTKVQAWGKAGKVLRTEEVGGTQG